ncbi:ATP-dependent RNA helicase [Alcanivorax sp. N3-2A]|nr:ATP-dependent RNA helicase [Alcanivorax sp. N3-2A]|tara:strand:+ start:78627 stop:80288 length:1662 start_codon:yes stop_codon:yes gene_type:complete
MSQSPSGFADLGLPASLLDAVAQLGFQTPSPIQAQSIPVLLEGRDLLGQAQTGTGKTAAFGLPLLARLDPAKRHPQMLVLAPTRELALQVAAALESFVGKGMGLRVAAIYGGGEYRTQLRALSDGAQVVVGTPGRMMDHIERGTLKLDGLRALVLDEADEMLRMGFIDDVRWVLKRTPSSCQLALFSATMPSVIRTVAEEHLKDPVTIRIDAGASATAEHIRQRFWPVAGLHKQDALCRILEAEEHDGVIVFARTKQATVELAEQLQRRGLRAEAINGDMPQNQREATVARLKNERIDLLVATDVVARGLDVPRVSHVFNYDMPMDTEAYVHRIGRTGRAGRAGEAILFVSRREQGMLRSIERATGQKLESMELPSTEALNQARLKRFQERLGQAMEHREVENNQALVLRMAEQMELEPAQLAAALATLLFQKEPLFLKEVPATKPARERADRHERADRGDRKGKKGPRMDSKKPNVPMRTYRVSVGQAHGVRPGNLVGAIANEAGLSSAMIGAIRIHQDHSTVALPETLSAKQLHQLRTARVCQQALGLEAV